MREITSISALPRVPAVYAMYGGKGRALHIAYVGVGDDLKQQVMQHLVRRDSSVTTGTSAVVLNPDGITEVRWWEHPDFARRHFLEAAELVAFDVLDPALRSRGTASAQARALHGDTSFREPMRQLFLAEPAGRLMIPTLHEALEQIAQLEQRVANLEQRLGKEPQK